MILRRLAAALTVSLVLAMAGDASPARAGSTFDAVAAADLVRISVNLEPAILQADLVDVGALTTQARLTSLGDSTAYAATPYPGELVTVLPGLLTGLLQLPLQLPTYPLLASASYPAAPHQAIDVATLHLSADSLTDDSSAKVRDGASAANASVTVDRGADIVDAAADATLGSFDVGSLVSIGGVRSSAHVQRGSDGALDRTSDFSVASLTVLGQRLRLGPEGLELAGVTVPGGLDAALEPLAALLDALAGQGIELRVLEAQDTVDGVVSAGLQLTQRLDTGINGILATLTVTVGRLAVSIAGGTAPGPAPTSPSSTAAPGSPTGVGAPFGTSTSVVRPDGTVGPGGSDGEGAALTSALSPEMADGGRFYPVLVVAAVVLTAVVDVFRKRGVKLTWLS